MKKIAVLITNYNYGQYIQETMASIREAQQAAGEPVQIELLVGDDKSTDDSVHKVRRMAERLEKPDFHIKLFAFETNRKPNAVISDLVKETPDDCEYTVVLDADDRLRPNFFRVMLHAAEQARAHGKDPDIIYSNCALVTPDGKPFATGISRPFHPEAYKEKSYIPSTSFTKTSRLKQAVHDKPFDTVPTHTKHARYKRLINDMGCEGLYLPVALFDYRQHDENLCGIGKATLPSAGADHRITRGEYYIEGETRQTMQEYLAYLQTGFGIDARVLERVAGDKLHFSDADGNKVQRDGFIRPASPRDAVPLAAHWGISA